MKLILIQSHYYPVTAFEVYHPFVITDKPPTFRSYLKIGGDEYTLNFETEKDLDTDTDSLIEFLTEDSPDDPIFSFGSSLDG